MLSPLISRHKFIFLYLILSSLLISSAVEAAQVRILTADIDGAISPAQVHLLEDVLEQAGDDNHDIVLLRLDTPGGLGTSMRDMVKVIMNSDVPVCIWVGPDGAHAASAGAFLVAAAKVSAMSPGTTIGSASPVSASGDDLPKTMSKKVKNDMVSLIKGIARERGRNIHWYAKAVEDGVSVDAQEAVSLNVVNLLAVSIEDFIEQLGAKGITIRDQQIKFSTDDVLITMFETGLRHSVLSWLLDPQVTYFLLIGGILGIFFELSHPGTMLPGVIGGFCFLTALYALSILPTNAAGLLLIIFASVLFILEAFIVSYGLLSVAAIISLFVGSLILFRGGEIQPISMGIVSGTVLSFSVFAGILVYLVGKSQSRSSKMGLKSMIGLRGEVMSTDRGKLKVLVRGEIWNAISDENIDFERGMVISVVQAHGLTLKVVRMS